VNSNGESDPYCFISVDGERLAKTKSIHNSLFPVWNEEFELVVQNARQLEFRVRDRELVTKDVDIGIV
jgi:Ca2+-dependent lipid-binding protein